MPLISRIAINGLAFIIGDPVQDDWVPERKAQLRVAEADVGLAASRSDEPGRRSPGTVRPRTRFAA